MLQQFSVLSRRPAGTLLRGMPEVAGTRPIRDARPAALQLPKGSTSLDDAYKPTDVVVWPESPAPFKEGEPAFRAAIGTLARQMDAPVIVGNIGVDQAADRRKGQRVETFNSASFIRPDGSFGGRYDKMHLVPFGEYTPYKQLFLLRGTACWMRLGTFVPGTKRRVFSVNGGHTLWRVSSATSPSLATRCGDFARRWSADVSWSIYLERWLVRRHERSMGAPRTWPGCARWRTAAGCCGIPTQGLTSRRLIRTATFCFRRYRGTCGLRFEVPFAYRNMNSPSTHGMETGCGWLCALIAACRGGVCRVVADLCRDTARMAAPSRSAEGSRPCTRSDVYVD